MAERRNRIRKPGNTPPRTEFGQKQTQIRSEEVQTQPKMSRADELRAARLGTKKNPDDDLVKRPTKREKKKRIQQNHINGVTERSAYDFTMIFIILTLCGFGLMMLYSVTAYEDMQLYENSFKSVRKQLILTGAGVFFMIVVSLIDYHFWGRLAWAFYWGSWALVLYAMFKGSSANGSSRWIKVAGITIQPTEMLKVSLIILIALIVANFGKRMRHWWNEAFVVLLIIIAALPVFKNNLSSGAIIGVIGMAMLYVSVKKHWPFYALAGGGAAVIGIFYKTGLLAKILEPYQMLRIYVWLDPFAYKDDKGRQTVQSLYAIASGGFKGKGLGQSVQKFGYLPEAQNDFIFGIICEELGIFGAIFILVLFGLLIWRLIIIAQNASDTYGCMLVSGILIHIGVQVFFNIGVATGMLPNTGIGLPFISSGGSAIIILMIEMGLALNVSKQTMIMVDD